ncbi:MAG: tetratricopeptide repeat protein [Candidatus Poribacteria bacterium]|nr:tetratricopeptide repeat protein [Candidatus Poribacteria bacterium]
MKNRISVAGLAFALIVLSLSGCDRRKAVDHYNNAVGLVKSRQYMEAVGELNEALRLRPDFPEAHNTLGYVYNQQTRYDEAAEHFRQAAENEKFKTRYLAYHNLGTALSNSRMYEEAAEALKQSIEMTPTPESHYALAQVYVFTDKDDLAVEQLGETLKLDKQKVFEIERDPVFEPLYENAKWRALMESHGR